jgi:uncharacterized repeat protein (TIGR01451 family)
MKTPTSRRSSIKRSYSVILGVFVLGVAVLAVPLYSANSSSRTPKVNPVRPTVEAKAKNLAANNLLAFGWLSAVGLPAMTGENVELFAADCATPKSAFTLGETVCAKTSGVSLSPAGNYYMNWIDSQVNETNGGTITSDPQYFLFVPPTAGTWKATIGRVTPADSSIIDNPPLFTVSQNLPGVSTFTPNCVTPKTSFVLGDTVCAKAAATGGAASRRRVVWIDPSGNARQVNDITADPESFSFSIPLTQTSNVGGVDVDNRGKWKVNIVSSRGSALATTTFVVTDPANSSADLQVVKAAVDPSVSAGSNGTFFITVLNNGPDAAANVVVTDPLPANTTFVGLAQSGPTFTCTTPSAGGTGTITCTIASLPRDGRTNFELEYQVVAETPANTTITNTATVSSDTDDPDANTNSSSSSLTVSPGGGGGGSTCTVACPDDIQTPANTTDGGGNPGAIVHFSPPSGNLACGTITVDHCNDCFFPEGVTVVTGTAETGESCSFTVTITPAGSAPTITCPANKTGNADSNCQATFSLGTATASGTNVTVVAFRSDGQPVYTCDEFGNCTRSATDAPFSVGQTTVTWYAYAHDIAGPYNAQTGDEESHRNGSATCTQTVTVNDVTPPTIAATDQTVPADSSCQAAVPDYSSTVSDNCACDASDQSADCQNHNQLGYSQTPAAGTMLPPGSYTVHIEANDGTNSASKDITLTVADQTAPQITCPANITQNTDAGICSATVNPGTATATDNCDTTPTIVGTRSDNQPLNASYPKGTTTIHWTATDDAGNSSSCDQTVTVEDHESPTISCPANITKNNDPGTCGAVVTYTTPVGQDNCPGATTAQTAGLPSGSTFPVGTTTNTFEVTDSSGNKTSCSFTVTVNDVENPVITCPSSQVLEPTCPSGAIGNWTAPVGTDNCPGAVTTRTAGQAPGSTFAAGTTTTITYTVNDAHGNSASCSFTITVKTVLQTLDDLRASVAANTQLNGTQRTGLLAKLDAAKQAIQTNNQNGACAKLADFINSTQNFINQGAISASTGNAWISTANHIRNAIGCTNLPCS